jgi:hypothetical protein
MVPALQFVFDVRNAKTGVGINPKFLTSAPPANIPADNKQLMNELVSLVSNPIAILFPWVRFASTKPSFIMSSGVKSTLGIPRIPDVPNSLEFKGHHQIALFQI